MSRDQRPVVAVAEARWRPSTITWSGAPLTVLLGALLGILTWPIRSITPAAGLDPSWRGALHLAAQDGIHFGSDIVFTFGPLGFLTVPDLYYSPTAAVGLLYVGSLHIAITTTLVYLGRQARPRWLSLPAVIFAAAALPPLTVLGQAPVVLAFLWSMLALRPGAGRRLVAGYPVAAGIATGFLFLVKFNSGLTLLGIAGITVAALALRARLRRLLTFGAAAAGSFLVGWLATGQRLADVPAFLVGSTSIATGYSTAMGLEIPGREWEYFAAAVAIGALMAVALSATAAWPRWDRLAVLGATAAMTFLAFKHGFVRHDGHAIGFFGLMLASQLPFGSATVWRRAGAAATVLGIYLLSSGISPIQLVNPLARAPNLVRELQILTSADARFAVKEQARAAMRADYKIDESALELLEGHTVAIEPSEVNVAWAYPSLFRWAPLPVFQTYSAYTAYLDELNAARLLSDRAPERLLRRKYQAIDSRNAFFESPAASLAIVCRYQQLYADSQWQVLGRQHNRCGPPRLIASRTIGLDESIDVPHGARNELVYAEIIGIRDGLFERVRAFLYKGGESRIALEGIGAFRLVPETAEDPLIMAVPPQYSHNSSGFEWPSNTDAFSVWYLDGGQSGAQLVVKFFAVEMTP